MNALQTLLPEQKLIALDGNPVQPQAFDDKVLLFVNVASKCGFTKQYAGLQKLFTDYRDQGLLIVGVPCNQFGQQEPGSAVEIQSFCAVNYGVTFLLLEKQDVNGNNRSPLYQQLITSEAGGGRDIRWNFEKFLVAKDGQIINRYGSSTSPESLGEAIEQIL